MKKFLLIVCTLALMASAAGAQPIVPALQSGAGITVLGRASGRVPADLLRFSVRLTARPASTEALSTMVQTIAQAIKKAGAQDVSTDVGPLFAPSQGLAINVTGSFPPIPFERVMSATESVASSLQNLTGVTIQSLNASYALRDCEAAEAQVRRNAIADALRRAQAIAQAQNLRLGSPIHDSETSPPSCTGLPNQFGGGALEVTSSPTVLITVTESVTYAILAK